MKVKIILVGRVKPLVVDIVLFDTHGYKDKVTSPEDFRSWLNGGAGKFISIGKKVINTENVLFFEVFK